MLSRPGHTEAAVDLSKLAGLAPVGVLSEIVSRDGLNMAKGNELLDFCHEHGLVSSKTDRQQLYYSLLHLPPLRMVVQVHTTIRDLRCYLREQIMDQAKL